eukprot:CAMPEP_0201522216 /NCGR_PEP_ID=MMETSP0161_2-20130828/16523_1 /ASSEMBLY_ACC=CAM_ASM_000251 /TAXON_ID=180227 /ORGANISM="Neoparamoeba aestuarina, Strain SoJaBio B1-5/56/2" /LENGTH=365 /DNA_ID=CAMNT_0047920993 /DNA_START=56 /DNA_END=1153 /DNA_ORIENTATION=-
MGCNNSSETASPEDKEQHKEIEKGLREDKKNEAREVKILLLGAGEAGKSTFAKQMRHLYGEGFNDEDRVLYKGFVTSHLLTSFRILLFSVQTSSDLIEKYGLSENKDEIEVILRPDLDTASHNYFDYVVAHVDEIRKAVTVLWENTDLKKHLEENKAQLQIFDTADYFFDEAARILNPTYVPTDADIFCCRVRTTGILENFFNIERNLRVRLIDVGGQRSERRKWIHCFEGVHSVLFFASLSEYDQTLFEDQRQNRMRESLQLFHDACGSVWFKESSMILFLNKVDLFKKKIKKIDLNVCFKSYTDGCDYDKAIEYISARFKREAQVSEKQIYIHVTCATDTSMVKNAFDSVKDSIFKKMMLTTM